MVCTAHMQQWTIRAPGARQRGANVGKRSLGRPAARPSLTRGQQSGGRLEMFFPRILYPGSTGRGWMDEQAGSVSKLTPLSFITPKVKTGWLSNHRWGLLRPWSVSAAPVTRSTCISERGELATLLSALVLGHPPLAAFLILLHSGNKAHPPVCGSIILHCTGIRNGDARSLQGDDTLTSTGKPGQAR